MARFWTLTCLHWLVLWTRSTTPSAASSPSGTLSSCELSTTDWLAPPDRFTGALVSYLMTWKHSDGEQA